MPGKNPSGRPPVYRSLSKTLEDSSDVVVVSRDEP